MKTSTTKELRALKRQTKQLEELFSNLVPTSITIKVKTVNIYITTPDTELTTSVEP
jgi:hypothetical protein